MDDATPKKLAQSARAKRIVAERMLGIEMMEEQAKRIALIRDRKAREKERDLLERE